MTKSSCVRNKLMRNPQREKLNALSCSLTPRLFERGIKLSLRRNKSNICIWNCGCFVIPNYSKELITTGDVDRSQRLRTKITTSVYHKATKKRSKEKWSKEKWSKEKRSKEKWSKEKWSKEKRSKEKWSKEKRSKEKWSKEKRRDKSCPIVVKGPYTFSYT